MTSNRLRLTKTISPVGLPILLLIALFIIGAGSAVAQTSPVHAEVDRDTVSTDETVTLSITILGNDASRPALPVLDGFQLIGNSFSLRTSTVNGVASSEVTYNYVLRPTEAGELVIPAITVTVDGQSYSTDPIPVEVSQGATPSTPSSRGEAAATSPLDGNTFFVEAEVDNPSPYLGQQVTYTFRFYQAEVLPDTPAYSPPDFSGFWSQQDTEQVQYFVDQNDVTYRVTELRTLLFPSVVGTLSIGPGIYQMPGGFFRPGATLSSNPITLTVRPVPEPVPDAFDGAVGQFSISAEVQPDAVAVNEPVTLRVTLEGQGNLETLPNPELPELAGWRAFESTSTMNAEIVNGRVTGERVYEQLLVPSEVGEYALPAISYTVFDPESESYQTISTEPIEVTVTAGAANAPIPTVPGAAQETITLFDSDIRYIKPVPPQLASTPSSLTANPVYWLAWLLPVLAIASDWAWRRRQAYRASNPDLVRRSQALKRARKALARARKEGSDPHAVTSQALSAYLSDKLSQPVAGLTQAALFERLRGYGVNEPLVERVCDVLSVSELGRFAPAGSNGDAPPDLLAEADRLISELDKVLQQAHNGLRSSGDP